MLNRLHAAANEAGYKVERSGNGVDFAQLTMLAPDSTRHVDHDPGNATWYCYRVRACDGRGNSRYTETREVGMW